MKSSARTKQSSPVIFVSGDLASRFLSDLSLLLLLLLFGDRKRWIRGEALTSGNDPSWDDDLGVPRNPGVAQHHSLRRRLPRDSRGHGRVQTQRFVDDTVEVGQSGDGVQIHRVNVRQLRRHLVGSVWVPGDEVEQEYELGGGGVTESRRISPYLD